MAARLLPALLFVNGLILSAAAEERPNILFIAIDDLNDWVGCLGGHPQAITPQIDRLAAEGMNFTNAHCQAPICNCSRVSLLLGKYPSTTGIYFLAPDFRRSDRTQNDITLPQYFRSHGYYTSARGKIFHGKPDQVSFNHIEPESGWRRNRKKLNYTVEGSNPLWDWGSVDVPDADHVDFRTAEWAAQQLPKLAARQQPFFLSVGFHLPHVPIYASRKWFEHPPLETVQLPKVLATDRDDLSDHAIKLTLNPTAPRHEWMVSHNQWAQAVQAYLAATAFIDSLVGMLLDALKDSGAEQNTIVVLWSDHGFHLGEKQRWAKRTLWEETTRVPLIIKTPNLNPGRCDHPVGLIDLFPTLTDLCGLPEKQGLEGHSLTQLLRNPKTEWMHSAITTFGPGNDTVRTSRWRYIRYADHSEELYDHSTDPDEWHNIAGNPTSAEVIAQLRSLLPQNPVPPASGSKGADSPLYPE
ncbi:MAG: sulfatase [Planctomycetaceae bacterium]